MANRQTERPRSLGTAGDSDDGGGGMLELSPSSLEDDHQFHLFKTARELREAEETDTVKRRADMKMEGIPHTDCEGRYSKFRQRTDE